VSSTAYYGNVVRVYPYYGNNLSVLNEEVAVFKRSLY